jgi:hypothetical protein
MKLLVWLGNRPMLSGIGVTLIAFALFAFVQKWDGVSMTLQIGDLVAKMTPLILAATFIERAVEILISPWRDTEASLLDRAVNAVKVRKVDPTDPTAPVQTAMNAADLAAAQGALDAYRGQTQKYAFAVGLLLSFFAAAVGVRALAPFVADPNWFKTCGLNCGQQWTFRNYDVLITTALLAGGADGLHTIISSITSFFPKAPNSAN